MTNRIDGRRTSPYADQLQETAAGEVPAVSDRALRAAARRRLDAFAAAPTTTPQTSHGPKLAPAGSGRVHEGPASQSAIGRANRPDAAPNQSADTECPNDDYDRCVDRTVPHPALWVEQGSDPHAIDRADVRQRQIGDCYVMAVLAGLTSTSEGRSLLQSAILPNTDSAGHVLSYTVTLHHPQRHWFSGTTFTVRQVDVPPVYARGHAEARPGDGYNEVWVLVMERAYAQYAGGYNAMGHGGSIRDAMEIITGHPARGYGLGRIFGRYDADDMQRDLLAGHVVVVASRDDVEQSRPDLVPNHAYLVTALERHGSKVAVRLWNPWGMIQPAPVSFDRIRSLFFQVDVGSAK